MSCLSSLVSDDHRSGKQVCRHFALRNNTFFSSLDFSSKWQHFNNFSPGKNTKQAISWKFPGWQGHDIQLLMA